MYSESSGMLGKERQREERERGGEGGVILQLGQRACLRSVGLSIPSRGDPSHSCMQRVVWVETRLLSGIGAGGVVVGGEWSVSLVDTCALIMRSVVHVSRFHNNRVLLVLVHIVLYDIVDSGAAPEL